MNTTNILEKKDLTVAILDKIATRVEEIMHSDDHDKALKLVDSAFVTYPDHAKLFFLKANIFFKMFIQGKKQDIQAVLDYYQKAVDNSKDFAYIKKYTEILLLTYEFMIERYKDRKHTINKAMSNNLSILKEQFPDSEEAMFLVAKVYQFTGDKDNALLYFRKIQEDKELYQVAQFYIHKLLKS